MTPAPVDWIRRAGVFAAGAGALAAGAALGVAAERYAVSHRDPREMTSGGEPPPFGPDAEETVVVTGDGVPLAAVTVGPPAARTIVLVHGYGLSMEAWRYQAANLADLGRIVLYDQRGHGRSGRGERDRATIDQLGEDLRRVIEVLVPEGPIVLVGHSMGGMTVMALADRHPDLFGSRIRAVGLVATSPGKIAEVTFGLPAYGARVLRRAAPGMFRQLSRTPALVTHGRRLGSDIELMLTKRYSFGSDVPAPLVEFASTIISQTSLETLADFWPAFDSHDKLSALGVLRDLAVLVVCGNDDLLTPPDHSRAIAAALPDADLVIVPNAGHLVMLEHPEILDVHLRELVERAGRTLEHRPPAVDGRPRRRPARWAAEHAGRWAARSGRR